MATRGYNSYRGRTSAGKIVLIVVLVLVLLGAVGYLVVQNYLVYDEAGQVHLELPFGHHGQEEQTDKPPVENVDIDRLEPESKLTPVTALHAVRLPDDCLWWGADYIMNTLAPEDMVLAVKRENGGITYDTQVSVPQNVIVERGRPLDCLKQLLASDRHTVGRICCFGDSTYAHGLPETALVREDGGIWYDANGGAWLDPTNPAVLSYITSLVSECAELGFDEILLDWFCYPSTGALDAIANGGSDHTQILTDFAKSLRSSLPEGVALSVTLRGSGDNALTVSEAAELFGLEVLERNLNASRSNTTRFAVFTRSENRQTRGTHSAFVFTVRNEAGALARAIDVIGHYGFNMRTLRSRPMKELLWQYYFYVEAEGDLHTPDGQNMLRALSVFCDRLRPVGCYTVLQEGI